MIAMRIISEERNVNISPKEKVKGAIERIAMMNEVAYQSMFLTINSAIEKTKNADNMNECFKALEEIRKMFDRCRRASDEIDRLSKRIIDLINQMDLVDTL
jgi:phage-related tail protein